MTLLISFTQNRRPGTGVSTTSETGITAGCSLKGGPASLLKELRGFARPCTRGLSVAGFFDTLRLFPGPEGFILAGEEPLFLTREASLLQPRGKECNTRVSTRPLTPVQRVHKETCTRQGALPGCIGRHIHRRDTYPGCTGRHIYQVIPSQGG